MEANGESGRTDTESGTAGDSSPQKRPNGATERSPAKKEPLAAAARHSKRDSDGRQVQQSGRAAQPSNVLFATIRTDEEKQQQLTAAGVERRTFEVACGSGKQHTDLRFPVNDRSLFGPGGRPKRAALPQLKTCIFSWDRPEKLASQTGQADIDWVLFRERLQASDIKQGFIGY